MRVILKVPWAKAGIHLKHLKPLNVGDIPVTLKPIVDEIWLSCDGSRSAEQIYEGIRTRYPDTTLLTIEYITDKITQLVEKGGQRKEENISQRVEERRGGNGKV